MKVYATLILLLVFFTSASLYAESTSRSTTTPDKASVSDSDTKNNEASALTDADKKPEDPELLNNKADSAKEVPLAGTTEESIEVEVTTETAAEEADNDDEDDEPDEDDC